MTRKDYIVIAQAFARTKPDENAFFKGPDATGQWETDVQRIASVLSNDNYRFNRHQFLLDCGYDNFGN